MNGLKCEKCGAPLNWAQWHDSVLECIFRKGRSVKWKRGEHLHYYCECGFDTTTPLLGAEAGEK